MDPIRVIEKLNKFVRTYPYPEVHRMLMEMVISLVKIRHLSEYQFKIINVMALVRDFIVTRIERNGGHREAAIMEMFEWTNVAMTFNELSQEDAKMIIAEAEKLLPQKENTLKQFLSQRLGLEGQKQFKLEDHFGKEDELWYGIVGSFSGLCEEKFKFDIKEAVSDKTLTSLIMEYYKRHGYEVKDMHDCSITADKGEENLVIAMSNYHGRSILVSVLPI